MSLQFIQSNKGPIICLLVGLTLGLGVGYFGKPTKIETVIKTSEQVKQDVKQQTQTNENKNKVITITTTRNKDGTVTTVTTITDKGQINTNTSTQSQTDIQRQSYTNTVIKNDIGLSIQALAFTSYNSLSHATLIDSYGIIVKKRIVGSLSGSVMVTTDKKIGIGFGMDF